MADVDIDPFGATSGGAERGGEHDRTESRTDENIPLPPVTPVGGGSTWKPECEQETLFGGPEPPLHGGMSQRTRLVKDYVKDLCKKLSKNIGETPEPIHFDYFDFRGGKLYYRGKNEPLTTEGRLKSVGTIADILDKNRLRNLGFDIPRGKLTARQAVMLNRVKEELPSESDIAKTDDIELQEIAKSTEDLIFQINNQSQTDDLFEYPLRKLLGLDKQLRSIMGSLKVEVAKKVQLEEHIKKGNRKLEEF